MPIRYDEKRIKRPFEEHEYTAEEIQELKACATDVNNFIKHVKIVNVDRGEEPFSPYNYQQEFIQMMNDNRFVVGLWSRQSGKTSVVGVYALWYAMFHDDKIIAIVSNKEKSAKMILRRIKRMYESVPSWLKPGVERYAETTTYFDNGSQINISATSEDAFRGESANLLIMDEFAFVPKNQAEAFWASNYPTISASKKSKIVIISTPNGMYNLFHRMYDRAEKKRNTFVPMKVSWQRVPGRDQEWADEQLKNIGDQKFRQEFSCDFLGSSNTVIDPKVLETLIDNYKTPILRELEDNLLIYEKPEAGKKYVLGCDIGKGTGEHDSTIQVLELVSMVPVKLKQVAVFKDNMTDVYNFSKIIDRVCNYYNKAYIMVENNAEGASVVNELWWNIENDRLVNTGSKVANLGVRATRSTKPRAVLLMKKLIEDYSLELVDENTIAQLTSFIEKGNKFYGENMPDDLVSGLYWACYILEMGILDESFEFSDDKKMKEDDGWGILTDADMNIEDDWSWMNNNTFSN